MNKKYNIYEYLTWLHEAEAEDQGETGQQPATNQMPSAPEPETAQTPKSVGKKMEETSPFSDLTGKKIQSVSFSPIGNGGKIDIKTETSSYSIQWSGTQVQLKTDKGQVISLAENKRR